METKQQRAEAMYAFIVEQTKAGRTCYLSTPLRRTVIKEKHLPMIRVRGAALEIQSGKNWLDYTFTKLEAI